MRNHKARVDPGIGTSRADYGSGTAQYLAERFLDALLHRHRTRLHLPPVISGTVIAQFYKVSFQL